MSEELKLCTFCHEDSDGYITPIEKNCHAFIRFGKDGWEISLRAKRMERFSEDRVLPNVRKEVKK